MRFMFSYSRYSQEIDDWNWNISDVTDVSKMFSYSRCDGFVDSWNLSEERKESMFDTEFNQPRYWSWSAEDCTCHWDKNKHY
jgi:hypothetical protein